MAKKKLNDLVGFSDRVPFKVFIDEEYLGTAIIVENHMMDIRGNPLPFIENDLRKGVAGFMFTAAENE